LSTERPLPSLPPSRTARREAWVGLFVIVGLLGVWTLLTTMTNPAFFRGRYIVTTHVSDAGGIRRGDPVEMRGVIVGRVVGFGITSSGVELKLEIEGEYRIPADSRVELEPNGLLGGLVVDVVPGQSARTLKWGDELPGSSGPGLFDKVEGLAGQASQVTDRLKRLLSDRTIENVQDSSAQLRQLLHQLSSVTSDERGQLAALSESLRRSAAGLEKVTTGPELEQTVRRVDEVSGRIDRLVASLDRATQALDAILARIDHGQGTLGRLSKDPALYDNVSQAAIDLDRAAVTLQKLLADVRREPKRYVTVKIF
jgi:phospholipid/cholesterol/gamma-HCH transport system substrate-binding protein